MATKELKFTKEALDKASHVGGAATRWRDARYPNLYLDVGARSKIRRFRKFWKGQNFTETRGGLPKTGVIEAAQTAAEIMGQIAEKGVFVQDDKLRGAGEIILRTAYEQNVMRALDPRQKKPRGHHGGR